MSIYAVTDTPVTTIVNLVVCDKPDYAASQRWIAVTPSATTQIGSSTPDGGKTWAAPVIHVDTSTQNLATIETNLLTNLAVLETWIANNPNGAVLTAGQTKVLAKALVGLVRVVLQDTATIGGARPN